VGSFSVQFGLFLGRGRYQSTDRINTREMEVEINYSLKEDRQYYVYICKQNVIIKKQIVGQVRTAQLSLAEVFTDMSHTNWGFLQTGVQDFFHKP